MHSASRYAIYYAPPEASALARFANAWLGWDPAIGQAVAHPPAPPLTAPDVARVTETPRRYGFHGTMKAPFRLAEGASYEKLVSAVAGLAATLPPVTLPGLTLACLGPFIALTPAGDQTALALLERRLVMDVDPLRGPPTESELARRQRARLTPRQDELLQLWGYPYSLDEFRFHLTLTGALPAEERERTMAALRPLVAGFEAEPFVVSDVCIFADPGRAENFRLVERLPLTG